MNFLNMEIEHLHRQNALNKHHEVKVNLTHQNVISFKHFQQLCFFGAKRTKDDSNRLPLSTIHSETLTHNYTQTMSSCVTQRSLTQCRQQPI